MATNILSTDGAWDMRYTCTGAVTVGSLVASGNFVGIANEAGTTGDVISLKLCCEANCTKKAAAATAAVLGAPARMLATGGVNKVLASAATGDTIIGYFTEAAATGATDVNVRLMFPSVLKGALFV